MTTLSLSRGNSFQNIRLDPQADGTVKMVGCHPWSKTSEIIIAHLTAIEAHALATSLRKSISKRIKRDEVYSPTGRMQSTGPEFQHIRPLGISILPSGRLVDTDYAHAEARIRASIAQSEPQHDARIIQHKCPEQDYGP